MKARKLSVGLGLVALATILVVQGCATPVSRGRGDFADFCAGCHGATGRGDGPAAAGLASTPADLTVLSAANGGVFPRVRVMSVIDGYTRQDQHGSTMPVFGPLLEEGPLVLVETGDGIVTPTPERLVALADYVATLQTTP
ncbi:MAG: cytochrome C [Paracoccaceae bacterium]